MPPKARDGYPTRIPVNVVFTEAQLQAIDDYVKEHNKTRSTLIREAVAHYIEYDLNNDPQTSRRRKYRNESERKAAHRKREKVKRQLAEQLVEAIDNAQTEEDIESLLQSLRSNDNGTN